jgi:hypothetical protein
VADLGDFGVIEFIVDDEAGLVSVCYAKTRA